MADTDTKTDTTPKPAPPASAPSRSQGDLVLIDGVPAILVERPEGIKGPVTREDGTVVDVWTVVRFTTCGAEPIVRYGFEDGEA